MPEFFFNIKGKSGPNDHMSNWGFPPIWSDKIEAKDKKAAKLAIEEIYDRKFPTRVLKADLATNEFLLTIKEIKTDDPYYERMFRLNICPQCSQQFKMIEKYQVGNPGGGSTFCSHQCQKDSSAIASFVDPEFSRNKPVIYKITHLPTDKCYIGKTTQVFTLRWYQHFFQGGNTKFHLEIKGSELTDWSFQIIEIISIPEEVKSVNEVERIIFIREMFWVNHYNSIVSGFNSVASILEEDILVQP